MHTYNKMCLGILSVEWGNGSPLPVKATVSTGLIIRMVFVPSESCWRPFCRGHYWEEIM